MARPSARLAFGTFDTWDGASEALRDLRVAGVDPTTLSFLGLRCTLIGARKHSLELQLRELILTKAGEPVRYTAGPLAGRLAVRVNVGAARLREALGLWLDRRHATRIQEALEGGSLMLCIRLFDARDERRACTVLLTRSSSVVEIHEFARLPQ